MICGEGEMGEVMKYVLKVGFVGMFAVLGFARSALALENELLDSFVNSWGEQALNCYSLTIELDPR